VTEFPFERGEILNNLVLLEDHAQKFACPYCMEKHTSKIIGYTEEIAMGKEGDEKMLEQLGADAREWRRKIQGLKEGGHSHEEHEHGDNCEVLVGECTALGKSKEECKKELSCNGN